MNCFLVTDLNWDNENIIRRRLKKVSKDTRIHSPYSKIILPLSKICTDEFLSLYRRSIIDNKQKESIIKILEITDYCMLFHNHIEYNTLSKYIIDMCEKNCIPYFIFSENTAEYIYNGEYISGESFKKKINNINKIDVIRKIDDIDINYDIITSTVGTPNSITSIIEKLRLQNKNIEDIKNKKSIVFLYDKNVKKEKKEEHKIIKDMAYLDFMNNKIKYLKSIDPKT